jgi:hypothetical protein
MHENDAKFNTMKLLQLGCQRSKLPIFKTLQTSKCKLNITMLRNIKSHQTLTNDKGQRTNDK